MTVPELHHENGVVLIEYQDLLDPNKDLTAIIAAAYGEHALGILLVRGVPGYAEKRARLLPLARQFAHLPEEQKQQCVCEEAEYQLGWSHGAESLDGGKTKDWAKGSYYANPQYDAPTDDQDLMRKYPDVAMPNVWPKASLPDLEPAFKDLGQLVIDTGILVARQCDKYTASVHQSFAPLEDVIRRSRSCKARLLHYFPASATQKVGDLWCGEHTDHGSLTGLTSAMYFDDATGQECEAPDAQAGLYIRDRHGALAKARIPADCIAFQMGECSQISSGGLLRATPHLVMPGRNSTNVCRCTFAVFMQPTWDDVMAAPPGVVPEAVKIGVWMPGMTFAEFGHATIMKTHSNNGSSGAAATM